MAENDWFSVVKVSTVWDSNVSTERLNYFIWNAFQTNTGKLDSFYRNNYYTYYELADKHRKYIEENKPEDTTSMRYKGFIAVWGETRKQLDSMERNTNFYLESLSLFEKYANQKNEPVLRRPSTGTVKTDSLARLSKKEFTDMYETVQEYLLSLGSKTQHNTAEDYLKKHIKNYSAMLSKRVPSGIKITNPYNRALISFKNTIREYE